MTKTLIRLLVLLVMIWEPVASDGYVRDRTRTGSPFKQPSATVALNLQVGCQPDACSTDAARSAAQEWNQAGARFTFRFQQVRGADIVCRMDQIDGVSTLAWASTVCGQSWGGALATTMQRVHDDGRIADADVIFNNARYRWGVYDGPLRSESIDFRRVALHELGHVLGLGHPDEHGQTVTAVMNQHYTNLFRLQPDDMAGIQAIYGRDPTQTPTPSRQGTLESPASGATVSGLGFLSGWKCGTEDITIRIDGGAPIAVAMDIPRADTRAICGREINNGFIIQTNWNWLGEGTHTAVAYDNGIEFARSTFTVGTTGEEFLKGVTVAVDVPNFPAPGETGRFIWNESTQHLELAEVLSDTSEPDPAPPPTTPTSAVSRFNGVWKVVVQYTTPTNFCRSNSGQEVTCTVVNGLFSCPYRDAVQGTISADGVFSASDSGKIRTLQGRLEGNSGSGTWEKDGSCDGTWTATKQSSFDHITSTTCTTLSGLRVEDYYGDPGRWDINIPCAPWNGYANVLHIDIVPLSPEGFDVDAGDLTIVQGGRRVTYDDENPDLTEALIWVDRHTQTGLTTILDYRLTEAPYHTTVIAGRNTELDFRQPFTVYYDDEIVAIFE